MTEAEWRDVWHGVLRGIIVLATLAIAGFHFVLRAFHWPIGPQTFFDRALDYWIEYFGYCVMANILLLFPWLQPWTGYLALLIAATSVTFGVWASFPEGVGLPHLGYGLLIMFGFWQLVGFRRAEAREARRGFPLD